jgi:hypothetical protein
VQYDVRTTGVQPSNCSSSLRTPVVRGDGEAVATANGGSGIGADDPFSALSDRAISTRLSTPGLISESDTADRKAWRVG